MDFNWILSLLVIIQLLSYIDAHFYPIPPPQSHIRSTHGNSWSNVYVNHDGYSNFNYDYPSVDTVHNNHLAPIPNSHFVPNNFNNHYDYDAYQGEPVDIKHRAVILTSFQEDQLPSYLKNPFYKNPRIRSALSDASRLHPGETPVFHRNAENIPRSKIYKLLIDAGFLHKNFY